MGGKEERKTDISILIEMGKKERKEKEEEWTLRNGGLLLEKRISYFNGKYSNLIHTFSAKELQKATNNYNRNLISGVGPDYRWYKGCFEGKVVFVKKYYDFGWYKGCLEGRVICLNMYNCGMYYSNPEMVSNEIAVAAQVSGHKNALKLLGCCLETKLPTPVFEIIIVHQGLFIEVMTLNMINSYSV